MVTIKNDSEIEKMRVAGKINYECHKLLRSLVKPGVTTKYLNDKAREFILANGCTPSFKDYQGFPGDICVSVNEIVVHGIPSERVLMNGDIISLDIGVMYKGFHSDSATTISIGKISKEEEKLIKYTEESLYKGLAEIKEGVNLSAVSAKIESVAKEHNLGIVKELVGHGVGSNLHEDPDIPNYISPDYEDITLKSGMTLAIEPMLTLGDANICILDDDWTIVTEDDSKAAHFEHTILVTKDGYELLTGE